MDWIAVEVWFERNITSEKLEWSADILASIFEKYGNPGVEIKSEAAVVLGYLRADDKLDDNLTLLKSDIENLYQTIEEFPLPNAIRVKRFSEKEWTKTLYGALKPKRIGKRLVVVPSWEEYEKQPDDIIIILDRCQAFGTGEHATTQLCLEILEEYIKPGMTILDVGAGSAILSIAAIKLGAKRAIAGDNDPMSVEAGRDNIIANGVQNQAEFYEAEGFNLPLDPQVKINIAVSNILSSVIISLVPDAKKVLQKEAIWIMSGITKGNWEKVEAELIEHGFKILEVRELNDWTAAIAKI